MNEEQWAAWVQAIGSVVAIFAAIGIAWWQWEADRRQRVAAERVVIQRAYDGITAFAFALLEELERTRQCCGQQSAECLHSRIFTLKEYLEWQHSPLALSPMSIQAVMQIRSTVRAAIESVANPHRTWGARAADLKGAATAVESTREAFARAATRDGYAYVEPRRPPNYLTPKSD